VGSHLYSPSMVVVAEVAVSKGHIRPDELVRHMDIRLHDALHRCPWRPGRNPVEDATRVSQWEMVSIHPAGQTMRAHVSLVIELTAKQMYAFERWCDSVAATLKYLEMVTEDYELNYSSVSYQLEVKGHVNQVLI